MESKENKKVYVVTEVTNVNKQVEQPTIGKGLPKYTRLPNPAIPFDEYRIVCGYCTDHPNMTRSDWMELAIIEKLHNDGLISDAQFTRRKNEINNRPPRGHRRGTKNKD